MFQYPLNVPDSHRLPSGHLVVSMPTVLVMNFFSDSYPDVVVVLIYQPLADGRYTMYAHLHRVLATGSRGVAHNSSSVGAGVYPHGGPGILQSIQITRCVLFGSAGFGAKHPMDYRNPTLLGATMVFSLWSSRRCPVGA